MTIANTLLSAMDRVQQAPLENFFLSIIAIPFIYIILNEVIRYNARLLGMKGPGGLPVIGNIWAIRVNAAETYRKWAKQYGEVYQIMLGNIPVVVVNSAAAAKVIFGTNAQALTSRPEFYTFHKVRSLLATLLLT